ncbi:MAG TPA: ABC transporter permease [Rectinemataceae bacterium]|nr:ABC transporter permease [Rectinemataceae bacterium]
MKAFMLHFRHDFRAVYTDPSRLFMNYLFPLTVFLLMAFLMTGVNPAFRLQMIPAMILFAMMSSTLLFLSSLWISQREAGIYRSYRINGVPARDILLAPALAGIAHLAIVSVLIAAVGHLAFGAPLPAAPVSFALGWLLSALALAGIAMTIGTAVAEQRAGMLVAQLVFLPSIMLGGLMMPADLIPRSLSLLSRLFPAPWAMEAMMGAGRSPLAMGVLAATALAGYAISLAIFEWHTTPLRPPRTRLVALLVLAPALAGLAILALGGSGGAS